ncbi:MAG: AbrB/MazE/SpoVT family DNA-binding domain-containing protein [bacterium]
MKIGERGQVTIPKQLRDKYGLRKDSDVEFIDEGNSIRIVKKSGGEKRVGAIRGLSKLKHGKNVDDYIESVRGQ